MLINLFQTIRSSGVPCTVRELLDLLGALENQLVYANIDDFYYLSRATLVKDEKYYDKFDTVSYTHLTLPTILRV